MFCDEVTRSILRGIVCLAGCHAWRDVAERRSEPKTIFSIGPWHSFSAHRDFKRRAQFLAWQVAFLIRFPDVFEESARSRKQSHWNRICCSSSYNLSLRKSTSTTTATQPLHIGLAGRKWKSFAMASSNGASWANEWVWKSGMASNTSSCPKVVFGPKALSKAQGL